MVVLLIVFLACRKIPNQKLLIDENSMDSLSAMRSSEEASIILRLNELRNKIQAENLKFNIGITSVSGLDLSHITGERELTTEQSDSIRNFLNNRKEREEGLPIPKYIKVNGIKLDPTSTKLDLREYGLVTDIKNQYETNSCWAFGANSAFESSYKVVNRSIIDASEQYVIDCSGAGTSERGGLSIGVFQWMVESSKSISSELTDYFQGTDGVCKDNSATDYFAVTWGLVDPTNNPSIIPSVSQIKEAICIYGAISASVFVTEYWEYYNSSDYVYKENEIFEGSNHAVNIIGWDDSKNAWIVKNSWGTDWGGPCGYGQERGYMWIDYKSNNIGRRAAWIRAKKTK